MDRPSNRNLLRHQLLLLLVTGCVFFTNLGASSLFDEDEPKNAVCGREMFLRNDWLVPTFNAELRTDKPILIYWAMLCSYTVFGVNEFAARFGSACLAVGSCLLTYHLGRFLVSARVGLLAAMVLSTSLMFSVVGRAVTPDSFLIFWTTAAFTAYCWSVTRHLGGSFAERDQGPGLTPWEKFGPQSFWTAIPMYVAMGFAVLAKGPVGVLLPCAIIGLHLLVRRQWDYQASQPSPLAPFGRAWQRGFLWMAQTFHPRRILAGMLVMRVPLGALIVLAIALPWYIAVGIATDGAWLAGFLGDHNVGRFLEAKENHSGPIFYYALVIFLGCFPWSVFLPLAVWNVWRQLRIHTAWTAPLLFLACWAGFWILFFSGASTKLPNYILPAYPAVALLIAAFLDRWQQELSLDVTAAMRWSCRALFLGGILLLIALPIVTSLLLPGESWLVVIGLIPTISAIVGLRELRRQQRSKVVRAVCLSAILLAVAIVGIAPAHVSKYQDGPRFGRLVLESSAGSTPKLATFEYFAPTLVFYAQTPVLRLKQEQQIGEFFAANPSGFLLTRADRMDVVSEFLPEDVEVLTRQRRFLRRHDLVLLGREVPSAGSIKTASGSGPRTGVIAH